MKYQLLCTSKLILDVLFDLAKKNDIEICDLYQKQTEKWPYFVYEAPPHRTSPKILGSNSMSSYRTTLTLEEMIEKLNKPKPIVHEIQLTDDYKATVHYEEKIVIVGCQNIPFERVEKLYKLINQ